MGKIVSVHSYRGGTGKSSISANMVACAAAQGKRVAVLDTDLQSPGIHVLFGLSPDEKPLTLLDFLWDKCSIEETAYDVTERVVSGGEGKCWLVPSAMDSRAISRVLDEGYDVMRLNTHFDTLVKHLDLDLLFIDTHPGLNKETMLSSAISDVLVLLIRPDQQDYYGTAVLKEVADRLEIPNVFLLLNKMLSHVDPEALKARLTKAFGYEMLGMLPLSEDMARLESRELIVKADPDHVISRVLQAATNRVMEVVS